MRVIVHACVIVLALGSGAAAEPVAGVVPIPPPPTAPTAPVALVTVTAAPPPPGISQAMVDAARVAVESLVRLRPGVRIAPPPGVVPIPPGSAPAYAMTIRVLEAQTTVTGDVRATVQIHLARGASTVLLTSGTVRVTPGGAMAVGAAIVEAARSAYRGVAAQIVP